MKKEEPTDEPTVFTLISRTEVLAFRSTSVMTISIFELPERFESDWKLPAKQGLTRMNIVTRVNAYSIKFFMVVYAVDPLVLLSP